MQYYYSYNHKQTKSKASYRALFVFLAKLLLIITITFLVMLINISKVAAQAVREKASYNLVDKNNTSTNYEAQSLINA